MGNPEDHQHLRNRLWATFTQPKPFKPEDVEFLAANIQILANFNERTHNVAQTRASLELIDTIRRFDAGSEKLAKIALYIAVIATLGTVVQAVFAVLAYFWPRN